MSEYTLIPLTENDNQRMLDVLKASPINANGLSLYFDKSPNIFEIPHLKYFNGKHLGFIKDNELKGFGSLGYYDAMVKGNKETVFTFYNFYLLPEARGKKLPGLAVRELMKDVQSSGANYGIALTMRGNRAAESYIGRRADEGIPHSRVADDLIAKTIFFSKPLKNKTPYKVRNAVIEDVPVIVKLLQQEHQQRDFGLFFTEESFIDSLKKRQLTIENYYVALNKKAEIKGVCLAWDCNRFRRTKVFKYAAGFYPYLVTYQLLEKIFPMAPFPKKGESFNELTITDYAIAERDPEIMHALLSEIYYRHHKRHYHFINWASCGSDPLLKAAKGFWSKDIISNIIFASLDTNRDPVKMKLPYIDIAFL